MADADSGRWFQLFHAYGPFLSTYVGEMISHQIGMSTRITINLIFTYFMLLYAPKYTNKDLISVGILWLILTLIFEWGGSLALGRPVIEILAGWNIFAVYMWPYVF